jgi:hypothetical protein
MTTRPTSRTPNLAELISEALEIRLGDLHTCLPGRIESYDASKQEADVKPLIKRLLATAEGEELLEELPIIPDVPVQMPRGGGFFASFPLQQGDHVLLIFSERSIDNFQAGDGIDSDPDDFRMHSLADAVAIPGWYPERKALPETHAENLVLGKEGGAVIHIKPDEIDLYEENAADFVALAAAVKAEIKAVRDTLNSHITNYNTHIHPIAVVAASGTGGTGSSTATVSQSSPPAAVGDVKADKTKAT